MTIVDANYILRYLLADDQEMFAIAKEVIENDTILILDEVLAEVVYVLFGVYSVTRQDITQALMGLLAMPNIKMLIPKNAMMYALSIYEESSLDFVDTVLCALSDEHKIATFDKKLQKCIDG